MKTALSIFLIGFVLMQCRDKKEQPTPVSPIQTAPVTSEGLSYNCKIQKRSKTESIEFVSYQINYSSALGKTLFNIVFIGKDNSVVNLGFDSEPGVNVYNAQKKATFIDKDKLIYECIGGAIEITKFDKKKNIISGNFYFDAFNNINGDTLRLHEGKFLNLKFKKVSVGL